jgi:hypothetical protein
MKIIPLLALVLLTSACSDRADVERQEPAPQPVATTGEAPVPPPAPPASPKREVESIEVKDARAAAAGPVRQAATQAGVNPDAAVLKDFEARIGKYLEIHKDAAKGAARLKETENPAEVSRAQSALADRIRSQRAAAKQGDIFTPEIRSRFRRLLAPEMKGEEGRDAKAVMKDDAPAPGAIPFKVNAKYPEGQPLPTVPSNVLLNLPRLPEPLEYRIIGKHLVLLDSDADIIVDYIPNAIS